MKIIGLTGGIASGKSTASSILKKLGATIIDADILSRKAVQKGQPALEEIARVFGKEILKHDGALNRKALGEVVFNDKNKLKTLNSIVHPEIHSLAEKLFEEEKNKGTEQIVYDAPLLIEENLMHLVDQVWLIYVDEKTQLERLMKRDKFTKKQAINRIASQLSMEEKKKHADIIINNNKTIETLEKQLKKYWYEVGH